MKSEIEAKFLGINHDQTRKKLVALGAVQSSPMFTMLRVILESPDGAMAKENAFVRVRAEHNKVTMTYKKFDSISVDGAKEVELTVDDLEQSVAFCRALGLVEVARQESKREIWTLDGTEIMLDEWPWLDPYIEIEASDAVSVQAIAQQLGLDWEDARFGDVMTAYREQYRNLPADFMISQLPLVRFGDALPELFTR